MVASITTWITVLVSFLALIGIAIYFTKIR